MKKQRGFSLIELLVVIGVVGVLVSLMLPALRGARASALRTVALGNVRTVGTTFIMHADRAGDYPQQDLGEVPPGLDMDGLYEPVGDEIVVPWYPQGIVIATTDYFDHAWMWPSMVAPIDEWPEHWDTWISPRKDQELPELDAFGFDGDLEIRDTISIRYANAFVARPGFFGGSATALDTSLLRATRPQDVRYPGSKVMLWDDDLSYLVGSSRPERIDGLLDAETPMCFADGHAAVHTPQDAGASVLNTLTGESTKLHNTKHGVRGVDY